MLKKGDYAFSYSIIVLLLLIFLLLKEYPFDRIVFLGEVAFGLLLAFLLASWLMMPKKEQIPDYTEDMEAIERLIQVAEANMDYDIKKSIEAYNRVKVYYSSLKSQEKSQVVDDALRIYIKLIEKIKKK